MTEQELSVEAALVSCEAVLEEGGYFGDLTREEVALVCGELRRLIGTTQR